MRRLRPLTFTIALGGALASLSSGCEESRSPDSGHRVEPGRRRSPEAVRIRDELIRLRATKLSRPERTAASEGPAELSLVELPSSGGEDGEASRIEAGDDWASEQLDRLVSEQLHRLAAPPDTVELEGVVAPGFRCAPLRPAGLEATFRGGDLAVHRADGAAGQGPAEFRGARGLAAALTEFSGGADTRLEIKSVGIELAPRDGLPFRTRALVEARPTQAAQVNATWTCTWTQDPADSRAPPRLLGIRVDRHEEVTLDGEKDDSALLFTDATEAVLGKAASFRAQQLRGIEYWSERVTRLGDMYLTGHHGLAVGDVNGDGLEDLYVCDGGSLPNRLYAQNPDGTVRDISSQSQVDWLEDSRGALLVDLDNDGDQDLVVATVAMIVFAENDGAGRFEIQGGHGGAPYPFSLSAADYDGDGDLDIYACVYAGGQNASGARGFEARSPVPFHDADNGGRNALLENFGAFRFADVTDEVGLDRNNSRWSFAAAWEDIDRDGDPDLYVANDFGRNSLYRNDLLADGRRRFVDIARPAGVEDMAAGMSVAWGDYNRDGRMDLYVGNMFSSAGQRISYQRNFAPGRDETAISGLRRMARGNSLFEAGATAGTFADVSEAAGVTMGRWAWSSAFADINNDGWEDIVVANGYMTNSSSVDL